MFVGVLLLLLLPEEATGLLPRPLPPKRSLEASLLRPPTSPLSTNYSHYHHHHQQQQQYDHDQSSPPLVIGMDEAGTGAIAGPIVAAAVWLDTSFDEQAELAGLLGAEAFATGIDCCTASWSRPAPNTFPGMAKAAGNYINAQLIKMEAQANGYVEAIALGTDGLVSEGSGQNLCSHVGTKRAL